MIALLMCNVMSFGVISITVNPKVIDFGTFELNKDTVGSDDWTEATLTWSGLSQGFQIYVDTIGKPALDAKYNFYIYSDDSSDYWYTGDAYNEPTGPTVWLWFEASAVGEYTIQYQFYSYESDWETRVNGDILTLKAKVVDKATAIDETPTQVESRKELRDGRLVIIRNGEKYSMMGMKE